MKLLDLNDVDCMCKRISKRDQLTLVVKEGSLREVGPYLAFERYTEVREGSQAGGLAEPETRLTANGLTHHPT